MLFRSEHGLKVGDGFEAGVQQGPLIDDFAIEKVEAHLADAQAKGARVVLGGKRHARGGTFFQPTVVTGATQDMLISREETFGPVAPLFRFKTEAEAIGLANASEFGLAAYFYGRDVGRIWRVAEALESGVIGINTGAIVTGNMGSKMRMNYTMMGDAVNLAARLESAAKQYGVYVMTSRETLELTNNRFAARKLDRITVVGKSEPVEVYEVMGENGKVDEPTAKLIELYNKGIEHYYSCKWNDAIAILEQAEELEPNREFSSGGISPSRLFIDRAKAYKTNPPPENWDGVFRLTEK